MQTSKNQPENNDNFEAALTPKCIIVMNFYTSIRSLHNKIHKFCVYQRPSSLFYLRPSSLCFEFTFNIQAKIMNA